MKGLWIGIVIVVLLLAATGVWTYLSTVTELPSIGFGLAVNRWVLFGILIVLAVIVGAVFAASARKGRKS